MASVLYTHAKKSTFTKEIQQNWYFQCVHSVKDRFARSNVNGEALDLS